MRQLSKPFSPSRARKGFAPTGSPFGAQRKYRMRLSMPAQQECVSDDGLSRLRYVTTDMNRDLGGAIVAFEVAVDRNSQVVVSGRAKLKIRPRHRDVVATANSEGIPYVDYPAGRKLELFRKASEQYGLDIDVTEFSIDSMENYINERQNIVSRFTDIVLEWVSSYRLNSDDDNHADKYYQDVLKFRPNNFNLYGIDTTSRRAPGY